MIIKIDQSITGPIPNLQDQQGTAVRQIDADADSIYSAVLGMRGPEYERAERDALAFKSAGFMGDVPAYVHTWASASGMSSKAAAEDILIQAAAWNEAAIAIRQSRLNAKAAIRDSSDIEGVVAAMESWGMFIVAIKSQLGL